MPRRGCDLICSDMEYSVIRFIRLITMECLIGFFPKFFASEASAFGHYSLRMLSSSLSGYQIR